MIRGFFAAAPVSSGFKRQWVTASDDSWIPRSSACFKRFQAPVGDGQQ